MFDAQGDSLAASCVFSVGPVRKTVDVYLREPAVTCTCENPRWCAAVDVPSEGLPGVPCRWAPPIRAALAESRAPHYSGPKGQDKARNWALIHRTIQKPPRTVKDHTRRLVAFFGSMTARRSEKALRLRAESREQRAGEHVRRHGNQPWWAR